MEIFGDRRIGQFDHSEEFLQRPFATHLAESRWQICMCETCQRKRHLYDSLPGKKIDWERYKKSSDWHYNAIFYVGE